MKLLSLILFTLSFLGTSYFFGDYSQKVTATTEGSDLSASVILAEETTPPQGAPEPEVILPPEKKKLKVLIVPGHEPDFGGTEFFNIKERNLNADLSLALAQYLVEDGHYDVVMTRDKDAWNPYLETYFTANSEEIKKFTESQKTEMGRLIKEGKISVMNSQVIHNTAPDDVAFRLFGINKWANEHTVDIIIHVHFNDNTERTEWAPGEYNGFAIYTPERQYSNAVASFEVAKQVYTRLSKMFPVSNLPGENAGIVEDQDLIAVGNSNTVNAASVLIEYGYIYEPQLQVPSVRTAVLNELAFQTYLGISDFSGTASFVVGPKESTLLLRGGELIAKKTALPNTGVLALQAVLLEKGYYPPEKYSRNQCPLSGFFGPCTERALTAFQNEFGIKGERGVVGPKTQLELQALFEPRLTGSI
ncbi:MAG: N-acetylmuramoyl-L-alanine amidase [Minisyncoccia bacterium]